LGVWEASAYDDLSDFGTRRLCSFVAEAEPTHAEKEDFISLLQFALFVVVVMVTLLSSLTTTFVPSTIRSRAPEETLLGLDNVAGRLRLRSNASLHWESSKISYPHRTGRHAMKGSRGDTVDR
jgi:hypothetical protein